jgi:hypothetical protein
MVSAVASTIFIEANVENPVQNCSQCAGLREQILRRPQLVCQTLHGCLDHADHRQTREGYFIRFVAVGQPSNIVPDLMPRCLQAPRIVADGEMLSDGLRWRGKQV